ncbi:MAG: S-methyl-5-thioribose-1-phosphate isomerase [Myxococcota bacterium]
MRVSGQHFRSIWIDAETGVLQIIDQTKLPHRFEIRSIPDVTAAAEAIRTMRVRGAPLIGAMAAHGIALALAENPSDDSLSRAEEQLSATRPTAINLRWALARMLKVVSNVSWTERADRARLEASSICDEDVARCEAIGLHGLEILKELALGRGAEPLRILTHCNAGWLATVDWGTALAPIYRAHQAGMPIHVWVDETRPRNQGASLTAFELREQGVPHTVIVDNAGGHLMQRGLVDVVLVGSDRTTGRGDVCNKIGTYLKALAAKANDIPFYVALPSSTIDWEIEDGIAEIPIEERDAAEVRIMTGLTADGEVAEVSLFPESSPVSNPAFDVTPASLVTGLITERGLIEANHKALSVLRRLVV